MATADVVRDVGDTLVYLLRAGIDPSVVAAADIFVATPDEFERLSSSPPPTITVFLYRVAVNAELRNAPRRTLPDGRTSRPPLPIELGYLITPWARDTRDEYRIVGRVLQTLYDNAEVGPALLQGDSWGPDDGMQLILETLSVEDHYRIWDTTSMPYRLSMTYQARVVGIDPTEVSAAAPVVAASFGRGPDA